ncbi:MAG: GerMN domain-containing protein [Bacillota bacterium]|nr:GerMN domain-containing protein [Bacillota bacterium]
MRKKGKHWTALALCILLSTVLMAGCVAEPLEETPEEPPVEESGETWPVTLYYVNDEYVTTGDEELDHIIPVEGEIVVAEDGNVLLELLNALAEVPEEPEGLSTVTADLTFLDAYHEYPEGVEYEEGSGEGTIFVDVSSEGLSGSSLMETFLIEQVVETLLANSALYSTEAFSCDRVRFLVDGAEAETLMGHYGIMDPFFSELQ